MAELLPSEVAANKIVCGAQGGLPNALLWTGVRAGLIMAGLAVAGVPKGKLLKASIYSAVAIEGFVLAWAWWHRDC